MYLIHHGIKGQKWGVRRYQHPNGKLTEEGKKRLNEQVKIQKDAVTLAALTAIGQVAISKIFAKVYDIPVNISPKQIAKITALVYTTNVLNSEIKLYKNQNGK